MAFGERTQAVLDDWRTAPIEAKLRATLGFLEKLTLRPAEVEAADALAARAAGASDLELEHAVYVGYLFNIYDRCADGLGWIVRGQDAFVRDARFLLKRGYPPGAPKETPAAQRAQLEAAVLDGPGVTAPALRRAAAGGPARVPRAGGEAERSPEKAGELPAGLAALAARTRDHAYQVTDQEVAALRAGHEDDALFELIVAAAVGAAAVRADAGLAALRA